MERLGGYIPSRFIANIIPVLFGFLGVVITNLPFSVFGSWVPSPMYALMPIYYWCLVRPDLMTPGWVLLIGLSHDVFSGEPIGLRAAAFVLAYALIDNQRDAFAGLSGWGAVLGFATASLAACASHYAITSLYSWKAMPVSGSIKEFAITALMYILVLPVLGFVHQKVVGPLRSEF